MSVYFVTCREVNAVKIGSSIEPHVRLDEIQWGCPLPLVLEAVMAGGIEEEFGLHRRFEDDRIRGEWFRFSEGLELVIKAHAIEPAPSKLNARAPRASVKGAKGKAQERGDALTWRFDPAAAERVLQRRIDRGDVHFPFKRDAA